MRSTATPNGTLTLTFTLLLWVLLSSGCGDDGGGTDVGSDAGGDSATDAGTDAAGDAARDAARDTSPPDGGFDTCTGTCAVTDLLAEIDGNTESLDLAYFGFNADDTLHVEAYGGADDGCPTMDSPSPARTLIVGSLPSPVDETPTAVDVTLLDFEGSLTAEPFLRSTDATSTARAAVTSPPESAFVRLDLDATFVGGAVRGALYATHCDSLDEP